MRQIKISSIGFLICLALFLACPISLQAESSNSKEIRLSLERLLLKQQFVLRKSHNVSGTMYFRVGTNEYICWQKPSGLFPLREDLPNVTVKSIRSGSDDEVVGRKLEEGGRVQMWKNVYSPIKYWTLSFIHPFLGKGELRITTTSGEMPDNLDEIVATLGNILKGNGLIEQPAFQGQVESEMLHFSGSGHLLSPDHYKAFNSSSVAQKEGFSLCPLCFNRRLNLSHIHEELEIGKECESTIRHYNLISKDLEAQARVERVGHKVLENWPLPLKGFHYRFSVIENDHFNAVACPGGYIFVNTGLLNALENDDELEAALAHEIAHVEQRHSIKEYLRARSDANSAAIAGALVGVATTAAMVTANRPGAGPAGEMAAGLTFLLIQAGSHIALNGYSREHEIEADVYALIYLQKQGKDRSPLLSVLKKVRSSFELSNPPLNASTLDADTHPDPKTRLFIINSIDCHPFNGDLVYDAFTKDGELVYSISFNAICIYGQRDGSKVCKVLSEITTTSAFAGPKSIDVLTLWKENFTHTLNSDGIVQLDAMDVIGVSFTTPGGPTGDLEKGFSPRLNGISVEKITKRTPK
jgi:hypothetical protein